MNIVDEVNREIWEFVRRDANVSLRPGTGYYSTPFRGTLFGEAESARVAEHLSRSAVDALWLGTNPRVPRSLEYILHPPRDRGDFPTFEKQMESGLYGSWQWDGLGRRSPDWNPIERPTGNWHVYRDALAQVARLERVAMANFLPWGSKTADELIERLGAANRPLLNRVLEFADHVNAKIVQALAPKLVVVPFSLGRNPRLDGVRPFGLTLAQAVEPTQHTVTLSRGTFVFHTGLCHRGRFTARTAFLPHPASLRLDSNRKRRVIEELVRALEAF